MAHFKDGGTKKLEADWGSEDYRVIGPTLNCLYMQNYMRFYIDVFFYVTPLRNNCSQTFI